MKRTAAIGKRKSESEAHATRRVRSTRCPKCGGEMHHAALRVGGAMSACVYIEDDSFEDDVQEYDGLDAWVCEDCGLVELHTSPQTGAGDAEGAA